MMKNLLLSILLLSSIGLVGQVRNFNDIPKPILEQLDSMGVDSNPLLNKYESAYFNAIFKDSLNGFNFTDKKIGFIQAGAKKSKKEYFDQEKDQFKNSFVPNYGFWRIFNAAQKEESGGYDGVIVYWSKRFISTDDLVKRMKGTAPNR